MKKSKATEALRVATDIAAIKAALKKHGYRLRKQAKQPVWKVLTPLNPPLSRGETGEQESSLLARGETGGFYTLTYQPAPISAWVLHPQNNDRDRHTLETIIQSAIKKQLATQIRRAS